MELKGAEAVELYRTPEPVTDLADKPHVLPLTHMSLPASAPPTAAHTGTGATLYYVLAGTGQVSSKGTAEEKQPGNVIYEQPGVLHQWANPGHDPLTLVVAQLSAQPGDPAGSGVSHPEGS
jgi:quercetin dioxygenase-like cupin family protein